MLQQYETIVLMICMIEVHLLGPLGFRYEKNVRMLRPDLSNSLPAPGS